MRSVCRGKCPGRSMSSGNVRIPTENIHVIQMDPTSSVKQLK